MLLFLAFSWLSTAPNINIYLFAGAGIVFALMVHHFGFLKIADKNLKRIFLMDDKKCLFAFIPWKSYLIIVVMIAMGAALRHSAIPKQYLAILYTTIGLALILSGYVRAQPCVCRTVSCKDFRGLSNGLTRPMKVPLPGLIENLPINHLIY